MCARHLTPNLYQGGNVSLTRLQRAAARYGAAEIETIHQSGKPEYHIRIRAGAPAPWKLPLMTRTRLLLLLVMISAICSVMIPQWVWLFPSIMHAGSLWNTFMA